jgi:DNA invertase Pin-like site-specific DNA recombinase
MLQPRDLKGRNAISYARWSSGRQAQGDSLRRQSENAERFCLAHGLTLDQTIVDDGVSAFKGGNLDLDASLGKFLADVKAGTIPCETVLIIEDLDRFTRTKPMDALPKFIELLNTGLTLVTLRDARVHSRVAYDGNPTHLMMSLLSMQAAHEYSAKISERVGDEWNNRAQRARKGRVKMSKVPFWIDQQTQQLNGREGHARMIFRLAAQGVGQWTITNILNEKGIPSSRGGTWGKSMVQDVLKSKAAYGSLVIKGEEVPNYFPPLISETEWLAIQSRKRQHYRNSQASGTTNLFPRLVRCGHCGAPMNLSSSKHGGQTYRYLICAGASLRRTSCHQPGWRYDDFEREFLDRVGFLAVPIPCDADAPDPSGELDETIRGLEFKRDNILAGVAEAETADVRRMLTTQADALSKDIERKRKELAEARQSAARYADAAAAVVDFEEHQQEIARLAKDDRKEAQRMLADLVERIELETDTKELRRVSVTMRNGASHSYVVDTSGTP